MEKGKRFRIVWEIDQWANTPEEAIAKAILAMPVPSNEDTWQQYLMPFDAIEFDENGKEVGKVQLDTLELEGNANIRFLRVLDGREDDPEYLAELIEDDDIVELERGDILKGHHADCQCDECFKKEEDDPQRGYSHFE